MSDSDVLEKIVAANPELLALFERLQYDCSPKRLQFPNGLRYRYFRARPGGRSRTWDCSWSVTRNANGRYLSFVHEERKDCWALAKVCEHRKRKDAKARALRLYEKRMKRK